MGHATSQIAPSPGPGPGRVWSPGRRAAKAATTVYTFRCVRHILATGAMLIFSAALQVLTDAPRRESAEAATTVSFSQLYLSLSLYIYIYIYIQLSMLYVYICMCVYIHTY